MAGEEYGYDLKHDDLEVEDDNESPLGPAEIVAELDELDEFDLHNKVDLLSELHAIGENVEIAEDKPNEHSEERSNLSHEAVEDHVPQHATEEVGSHPQALPDIAEEAHGYNFSGTAREAKDWVASHPYQTVFHVASGVTLLAPGLVTVPILGLAGFGATGIGAGEQLLFPSLYFLYLF